MFQRFDLIRFGVKKILIRTRKEQSICSNI